MSFTSYNTQHSTSCATWGKSNKKKNTHWKTQYTMTVVHANMK